jgi:hypothetical protein
MVAVQGFDRFVIQEGNNKKENFLPGSSVRASPRTLRI